MERPRFSDHLEAIKFIYDKFAWLSRMSGEPSTETRGSAPEARNKASETTGMHLYFPFLNYKWRSLFCFIVFYFCRIMWISYSQAFSPSGTKHV
ncbi:hypothetical protein Hanom_Chr14g01247591 [Helianthus anomalus]